MTEAIAPPTGLVPVWRVTPDSEEARWQDLLTLSADLIFETDAAGKFVMVGPDPALGWSAATLTGQPADLLLAGGRRKSSASPFHADAGLRQHSAWLQRADGVAVCLSFVVTPLRDGAGRLRGARGLGHDVTDLATRENEAMATQRRFAVLDQVMARVRGETLAPRMIQVVLDALIEATGCEGLTVLVPRGDGAAPKLLHSAGRAAPTVLPTVLSLLSKAGDQPLDGTAFDGRPVLVCPTHTQTGQAAALALWREGGAAAWGEDAAALMGTLAAIIRMLLEHEHVQTDLTRHLRNDTLTGLFNRRAFMEEIGRRFERLDVDTLPGALMLIELDNFATLDDKLVSDEALRVTSQVLRNNIRSCDLAAHFGGGGFALWLDGAEQLGAAERAEHLRQIGPAALAYLTEGGGPDLTWSIGIAARWPGDGRDAGEDADMLVLRAQDALGSVKLNAGGHWRAARDVEAD